MIYRLNIEAGLSLEYGFSDVLQGEFSANRANELEDGFRNRNVCRV